MGNEPWFDIGFGSEPILGSAPEKFLKHSHGRENATKGQYYDRELNHARAPTTKNPMDFSKVSKSNVPIIEVLEDFARKRCRDRCVGQRDARTVREKKLRWSHVALGDFQHLG
ncbi:MAG TPA: hypothetical protein VLN58_05215 [Verrucomicrobiae bacterium]|nr:hypothetical protein [Verrucomicrobiae bacterium]